MDKLVTVQCATDDPAPLLQAAGDVLALADVLRPNATAQPFTTEAGQERPQRSAPGSRRTADSAALTLL